MREIMGKTKSYLAEGNTGIRTYVSNVEERNGL